MAEFESRRWDLTGLVGDPKSPRFEAQVGEVRRLAESFARRRGGLRPTMTAETFSRIIADKERIIERMSVIGGFASLSYAADTQSDEATSLATRMSKMGSEVSNQILFFDLWWKTVLDAKNARRLVGGVDPELRWYLEYKRRMARYSLTEPEERIVNTLDVTGASALVKLYDKITGSYEYKVRAARGGRTRTVSREQLGNMVKSNKPETREAAYRALLSKYSDARGVLGEIYQNIVLNWRDEGVDIRGFDSPISIRNAGNDVDDATVRSLLDTCRAGRGVFQRFFAQKARMIGVKKLRRYDLYAPLPSNAASSAGGSAGPKRYTFGRAAKTVLDAMAGFDPGMAAMAKNVLDQNHIDVPVRPGKRDGAFCSTLSPGITPFVLVNFTGRLRDVFTLAHELGHAVHSQAAAGRSILVQEASLPLAETASTFSELLLYDHIAKTTPDDRRRILLSEKIDDLYATIMRQSFFTLFEVDAHRLIGANTTVDGLSSAYLANLKTQFGGAVGVSEDFGVEWICIPHFYHSPFYCYAYAFGNLLALSLFQRYKKEGADFVPAYMDILSAGGAFKPEALLARHGLDIGSARFWRQGFDYVRSQVREISRLG